MFLCVSCQVPAGCHPGDSSRSYLSERKKMSAHWGPEICPGSLGVHSAIIKFRCLMVTYSFNSREKDIPGAFSSGKKAFQTLSYGKWLSIDFLILYLNLCCLALAIYASFLLCKYDRSVLIPSSKCLIKLNYTANHKLANRKLLPQSVTNYVSELNKESNHLCYFSWVWQKTLLPGIKMLSCFAIKFHYSFVYFYVKYTDLLES